MGVLRLGICVGGVYAAFLLWAIAQERLSTPFPSTQSIPSDPSSTKGDRFPSPLFLNYAQALASCLSATTYLLFNAWRSGDLGRKGLWHILGFEALRSGGEEMAGRRVDDKQIKEKLDEGLNGTSTIGLGDKDQRKFGQEGMVRRNSAAVEKGATPPVPPTLNGATNMDRSSSNSGSSSGTSDVIIGRTKESLQVGTDGSQRKWRRRLPALLVQVSTFQTIAGPIGFLALRHISFPTMVLGKSCKLIPVMMLNVLLYRRRFSAHKYLVVALVTAGISVFMLLAPAKPGKGEGQDSLWGLSLLLFNLFVDGLTNSTQDQIFTLYPHYTGQQMMFHMSLLAQLFLLPLILLPLPSSPSSLLHHLPIPLTTHLLPSMPSAPLSLSPPAFFTSTSFLLSHPTALPPLLAYALLGGLGQLFIFETIQHFGSLTLTMVTVTRKLFTMLLSVLVFEHKLSVGQWIGVGIVFAGIAVEAGVKRRDVARKARRD